MRAQLDDPVWLASRSQNRWDGCLHAPVEHPAAGGRTDALAPYSHLDLEAHTTVPDRVDEEVRTHAPRLGAGSCSICADC